MSNYYDKNEEELYVNDENLFTTLEGLTRKSIESVIINDRINGPDIRTNIAFFIILQKIRNPINWNKGIEFFESQGLTKLEYILHFRMEFRNRDNLLQMVGQIIFCNWILYSTPDFRFPVNDYPILETEKKIYFPLSPKHLLVIKLDEIEIENINDCPVKNNIEFSEYRKFKELMIEKTKDNIIFSNKELLEEWKTGI
jgi:hypothetical protein